MVEMPIHEQTDKLYLFSRSREIVSLRALFAKQSRRKLILLKIASSLTLLATTNPNVDDPLYQLNIYDKFIQGTYQ